MFTKESVMREKIKTSIKLMGAIAIGSVLTGCISFGPPKPSANFPVKFDQVPMAKALPVGVKIDASDYFKDENNLDDALSTSNKVAIAKFNLTFVVEDRVAATTGDGNAAVMDVVLSGVSKAQFQAITDAAYADLVAQLKAAGREIVPVEKIRETVGYHGITFMGPSGASWNTGMDTEILTTQERTIVAGYWPSGLPGWYFDVFNNNNHNAVPFLASELKATVLSVDITVHFTEMETSGRGSAWFSSDASVNAKQMVKVVSSLYDGKYLEDFPSAGEQGIFTQEQGEVIDVPGTFAKVKNGSSSESSSLNKVKRIIEANPAKYSALVLKGIQTTNAAFVGFANENKP